MLALLTQVAEEGIPRNTERAHKIAGPIWELIHADLRILFFVDAGQVVVCAAAFVKKSRKVPRIEISRAEAVESRYQESKHAGRLTVEEESE